MEKLKKHLSTLSDEQRKQLARRVGTTPFYLRNIAYGMRSAGPKLAAQLERETGGAVTRKDFFPDDWHLIWPELK